MPFVTYSPYAASLMGTRDGPLGSLGSVCMQTLHATALPRRGVPQSLAVASESGAVGPWGTYRRMYHCVHSVPRGGLLPHGDPASLSVEGSASGNRLRCGNWTRGHEFALERVISTWALWSLSLVYMSEVISWGGRHLPARSTLLHWSHRFRGSGPGAISTLLPV